MLAYVSARQLVFGLERLVDMTIAKKVPPIAYATTVGIRFCNNVIGGWGGRGGAGTFMHGCGFGVTVIGVCGGGRRGGRARSCMDVCVEGGGRVHAWVD